MSIWDDYKTSVRTRINVKQDRLLLTERQWKLKHYVKLARKRCGYTQTDMSKIAY